METQPDIHIPGYQIISQIGEGAMGAVYKARQVSMDRIVAIKVLSPEFAKDVSYLGRFLREARLAANLHHPNIINGIDSGEADGAYYFVMEHVEGESLFKMMCGNQIGEKDSLDIIRQIAEALDHAYHRGVVHRDIKPENILLAEDGTAKLCDLGLAKRSHKNEADFTAEGQAVGTPYYISPEQARAEDAIDIRSDIYSLGATLYHMVAGVVPYDGPNQMVILTKHMTEPLVPPNQWNPKLGAGATNLILRMMQKDRSLRYQSPAAVISAIDGIRKGQSVALPAVPKPADRNTESGIHERSRTRRHTRRSVRGASRAPSMTDIVMVLLGLAVAVGIIAAVTGGLGGSSREQTADEPDANGATFVPEERETPRKVPENEERAARRLYDDMAEAFQEERMRDVLKFGEILRDKYFHTAYMKQDAEAGGLTLRDQALQYLQEARKRLGEGKD